MTQQSILLRRADVQARLSVCRSFIIDNVASGNFPPPVKIGPKAFRWRVEDVDSWAAAQALSSQWGKHKNKPSKKAAQRGCKT